jgi:hypothetical protein
VAPQSQGKRFVSNWIHEADGSECVDHCELLGVFRSIDGGLRLEDANLLHCGSLEELEGIIYA